MPISFCVLGMLVDIGAMQSAIGFGSVLTMLAIVTKILGCGIPALAVGFNARGAWRIGVGMMPRGEVALIIAGVGIAEGLIDQAVFGVAILMTIVTTMLAPMIVVPAFQSGGSGLKSGSDESKS